jgi:4a-hydroxytetrahydrobiopterin dehydratase
VDRTTEPQEDTVAETDDRTRLTGQQVLEEGLDGWRVVLGRLQARFGTGDFSSGARLVAEIARVADEADHHPDVDLRYPHVTVTLVSHDVKGLTARDVRLARRISELAADAGADPDPAAPQLVELALDTPSTAGVLPFWQAVLGYDASDDDVTDPAGRLVPLWFQPTQSSEPDRQRFHVDVSVPHDVAQQRIAAAIEAGGTLVDDRAAPSFWVLADAEGNKACICTWEGRD